MPPPWLHSRISKDSAEEKLNESGMFPDGKFLVRAHSKPNEFVLSVCFKGRATHHHMAANEKGTWTVNNKEYGEAATVEALIALLKTKPAGWPVTLTSFASNDSGSKGNPGNAVAASENGKKPNGSGASKQATPPWYMKVTKVKAEELLAPGGKDGQFLVRGPSTPGSYVLSITFRGKPTHHKLAPNEEGVYAVNGKLYGPPAKSLKNLIAELAKKPAGWPVPLAEYVTENGEFKPMERGGGGGGSKSGGSVGAPKPKRGSGRGEGPTKGHPSYVYSVLSNTVAEERLSAHNNGANADGTFLIRCKPNDKSGNNWVLSVIFRGKPTHHRVFRETSSDPFTVNKSVCEGVTTLSGVAKLLQTKKSWWPVPLKFAVKQESSSTEAAPSKIPTKDPACPPTSGSSPSWLVDTIQRKDDATKIVAEHCSGDISGQDGAFCVWSKPNQPAGTNYVVSVVYRSQMTHHGAINENGNWTINKKPIPGVDSIESVVDFLGQKRSFWPVPLVNGVGTSDNVDMSAADTANTEVDASDTPTKKKSSSDDASAEAASIADANETKGDDDDGLPAPAQRDNTDMSALILDGNGAPVVVGGTNEPVEEVEEPAREFEGGTYEDVELTRESLTSSYGLQVRESWLGVGKGHAVVVSAVIEGSPADQKVKVDDILVQIDGILVETQTLEHVKEVLRELGTSAEVKLYRRRNPSNRMLDEPPQINSITKAQHLVLQEAQMKTKPTKKAKATIWGKPGTGSKNPRKVSSIWDGTYNDGHGMTPKTQEKELKRLLRDARRSGQRLDVVVTQHAIIDPNASKLPQYTTA